MQQTNRQLAKQFIAVAIRNLTNNAVGLHDMSDSHVLCEQLDIMEDEVEGSDSFTPTSHLHDLAQDCALEILLDAGYPI